MKYLCAIVAVYTLFTLHQGTSSILVNDNAKTVKAREGTGVLFPCNVTEFPDLEIWWTKNETGSGFLSKGLLLRFNSVSRAEAGDYLCHVKNISGAARNVSKNVTIDHVTVDVLYPATVRLSGGPSTLTKGESLTLRVAVDGNPGIDYALKNNDTDIVIATGFDATPTSFSLTYDEVWCYNGGLYILTGNNELNAFNDTQYLAIDVLCPPDPDTTHSINYVEERKLGDFVIFQMWTQANPRPTYTWTHNGRPAGIITEIEHFTSILIQRIEVEDFGEYTLVMENSEGSYEAHYNLRPTEIWTPDEGPDEEAGTWLVSPPEAPRNFRWESLTYDSVTLSWDSGYDNGETQHFLIDQYRPGYWDTSIKQFEPWRDADFIDDVSSGSKAFSYGIIISGQGSQVANLETVYDLGYDHHVTHTVYNLISNYHYELTVVAANAEGRSDVSEKISFNTPDNPNDYDDYDDDDGSFVIIVSSVCGGLGLLIVAALTLYCVKYRRMRTSYADIPGGNTNGVKGHPCAPP